MKRPWLNGGLIVAAALFMTSCGPRSDAQDTIMPPARAASRVESEFVPDPEAAPGVAIMPVVKIPEVPGPATAGIVLADGGESRYRIVLDLSASASEEHAAEEIQTHFHACTGVLLPIVKGEPGDGGPMIVLGRGPTAQRLGVHPTLEELGDQSYVAATVEDHVVIAGSPSAGTLYGARDFLETDLGVRWYAPGVTKAPPLQTAYARRRPEPETVRPSFTWRYTCYRWPGGDDLFHARRAQNNGTGGRDNKLGIQYAHDGRCHTYFRFVSPDEYFDAHPDYFSEIGGKRVRDETQLCLTHPDVLEIVTEKMLRRMRERPEYVQQNFSQEDWYAYCECDRCSALNERLGTAGGTQFWFVNQLAERTSVEFPHIQIGTLAYTYTEEPPKDLIMHPNVAVWLCHMFPSCQSHPIATCEQNAAFRRRAERWAAICDQLYIWYYVVDFAHYYNPYPNFGAIAADLRFFHDIGVKGVYAQGMSHGGGGGEFSLLRPYYVTQLMKDHTLDPDTVLYDFLQGYYGAAAPDIYRYGKLLQHQVDAGNIHMHLYTNPAQGYLTDEIIAVAEELFDSAEEAVTGDEELLERVRVCRMPLAYARWFPRNGYEIRDGELLFRGDLARPETMVAFVDRMQAHGFQNVREWGGSPEDLVAYSQMINSPVPVATIRNDHLTIDIVPLLGARAVRIIHNATGHCITAHNVVKNLLFPFAGGEDSRVGAVFGGFEGGPMAQARVANAAEQTGGITLEMAARGVLIRRHITLDPDRPVVAFVTTVSNPSDTPTRTRVKSHLDLDLGEPATTRLAFETVGGQAFDTDLRPVIARLREGKMFHAETRTLPAGEWTFSGSKGLQVTQRFDSETVDLVWVYAYPEDLESVEVELWRMEQVLEPGEQVTLRHELEIRPVR